MSLDPKNIQEMRRVAQSAFDANVDKSTLINDLSKDGWGALYLDEAALYYDGLKKKVQKQPVAAGVSPSTSAKPVSLSELRPIKGSDIPPYLQQEALKQQEIFREIEKDPAVQKNIAKKNLFNKYEGAISTVDSLDKSGETDEAKYRAALSGLSDAYDNYKQKTPDVNLPDFYDARGGVNPDALSYIDKTRTITLASEAESKLKSEANRSNFLEAGVKQVAGSILGLVGMAHKYMPNPAVPYDVARALKENNLLLEKGEEITSQAQREMIGRRLEAGYTQEQIDSGFVGEAAKGNYGDALGLLGQDMLDQTVNFVMTAINPAIGLGVLGASAAGSAYLQVKDDDRYSDAEKLVYATTIGAAEYIAERLFMTDINMSKAIIKSLLGKAGVKKVSDIPKKEFADMLFGKLPKALRAPLEEGTEELFVGVVQQSLDKIMADKPFKPVELAEATILGASMGGGISVLHKGLSAIGKIADLNQTISIRDRVDKINTLLQDPNITDEERSVLTNRLKVAKKEEERIMNSAAIFYANYSQEDAKATLEANQKLSSLLKSADKVKSEEGRAGIIDEIKTQIDTLKQIESKYDSKKGQQVPGAVQAGAQPGGIQQPGEGTGAAAPGGVLQTPEQEALASRVSAADSSAPKLGFKMKTPKRVPLNKDTAPEVYRSLLEAVDNYSDETLAQMQTTREEVREGVKSLFDVVSSLTKSGRDVSVDVYGSVADLNKGLGVSVKKQGRQYVISNESGTEFYRTNKKKDADRWMNTFQTRGVYLGRNQDGVTNVAILMPAMVANTGYHEGLHDVIPYVFGDVEISKIARAMAKATKSSARLSDKMLRFIRSYERDGEATQNDEFLTELASLISSGEIEVEVKDSIIDRFMKGLSDILGNPDFLKRKPSTEQFVRLLNEIAKRIGEGRELSVDISKGEVSGLGSRLQKPTEGTEYGEGPMFSIDGKTKFFHASDQKRRGRLKKSTAPQFGSAVYFSTSKKRVMDEFGDNVTEVELDLKNPLYTNTREFDEVGFLAIKLADDDYGRRKNLKLEEDDAYFYYDFTDISELAEIPGQFISQAAEQMGYDAIVDKGSNDYENEIAVLNEAAIIYEEDKPKFQKPSSALKDVESTTKALDDVSTFDQQDAKAEVIVGKQKDRWGRSQVWRERIENAGDILREISSRGKNPDVKYIEEKIDKIKNWLLKESGFDSLPKNIKTLKDVDESNVKFSSAVDGWEYLNKFHNDVLQETIDAYKGIVVKTQEEQDVKDFILTLLQGDKSSIFSKLLDIGDIVFKIKKQGELKSTPLNISEAYHKAKKDGSNPELVKAVEELLSPRETDTPKFQKPTSALNKLEALEFKRKTNPYNIKDFSFFASFGNPSGFKEAKVIGKSNDRLNQTTRFKNTDFYTALEILPNGDKKLSIHFKHLEQGSNRGGGHAGLVFVFDSAKKIDNSLVENLIPKVEKFRTENFTKENNVYRINTNLPKEIKPVDVREDSQITQQQKQEELLSPRETDTPKFQKPTGKGAKNFDKWVGGNRLVTAQELQDVKSGEPIVVRAYHGTTNDFYEFDSSVKGNIEGHLGKLNYFTTDFQDASANYQSTGADLTSRIERRAEDIENFLEDEFDDFYKSKKELSKAYGYTANQLTALGSFSALAKDIAKKELQGGEERVLDVYIKLNNPVVLGNYYNKTWVDVINLSKSDLDEAAVEIADENDISVDEAKSDYESDIRQRAIENTGVESVHVKALERALRSNNYDIFYRGDLVSNIIGDDYFEESIELSAFENQMRKAGIDVNDEGEYAVGQVIADFFKNLGYDGIVLTDVSSRFKNMGLGGSTSHIHVFDDYSNQIKLADGSNVQFNEDTRDIRFQKPGEYKKAVEAAQAEVTNSVGAIFQRLGVDLGKPITRAKAIERRAKMQLPEIDPFKLFKKKYGEGAAKAIRTHVPSAMDYPQQFIDFIEKKVPLTQQIGRVVSEIPTLISADFQLLIGRDFKDRKITGKTPEEILKETDFTFHRIKSNKDMRVFRADYDDNEVVCTLRDPNRINDFLIFWVRNKYADSILPANKLTIEYLQGDTEGARMWRKYLKDVHDFEVPSEEGLKKEIADLKAEMTLISKILEDTERLLKVRNNRDIDSLLSKMGADAIKYFDLKDSIDKKEDLLRKLNLPNALQDHLPSKLTEPSREDPYGRSSMSVQIGRGDNYIYKITNRYNHSASEPADSTLDKDLDNLVEGLQEAVLKLDEVTSIAQPGYKKTFPDGIITDFEGNYMAYDYSVDGEWYGTSYFSDYGFYVQDGSFDRTITKIDPNTQKIFMGVVFDTSKKTAMRWKGRDATELIQGADTIGLNIDKIQFSKNSVDIMTSKGGVRIEKDGDDFKLSGNITQIEDGFYFKAEGVKSIDFPNLVEIGDEFMVHSYNVTYLNMPRVKIVGNRFLAYNTGNYDSFNMQSLEHVEFEFGGIKYHDISFPSLISVGNNFAYGSNFLTFSAPKLEFVGDKFLSTSVGVRIYLPSLSEAGSYFLSGVKGRSDLNSTYFWLPNLKKYGGRFLNGALVKEVFMPGANKLLPVQGVDLHVLLHKYNKAKDDAYKYVRDNYPDIGNLITAKETLNLKDGFSFLRGIDTSNATLKAIADELSSYDEKIEGVRDFFKIGRADYNDERIFDFMFDRVSMYSMRILEAGDYRLNDVSDIPTSVSGSRPKFQRPIDQTYEKSQERLKPSAGMGLSGAEKAFIDRQAPLKRALIKANLNYARNLLISQAGSGARAYDFITTSFKNIYGGLTNDQIKNVDKLIFLRRVIQIHEYKAANPQAEKIVHPDNWDGLINNDTVVVDSAGNRKTMLSAKKALADMKSDLGVTEYNLIYNATERYFDTYKKILTDMFEAGLITQGLYDELKNLKYQPRVFINKILMRDENDPSEFRANLQDLSLRSAQIKKLTTGDVSEVIMDSRFLLAVSANSAYSRIAKNKTKREVAKGLGRPDTQDFMSSDKRTGFEEVIYYEDGIKKSFYLRGDLKSQLDDISSQIFQPEVAKLLSTITGSRLIKLFATQANPLFVLKNIPRDYQHVLFFTNIYDNTNIYNAMYLLARDYIKGAKGKLSNSSDFKEFLEYGGGMNFFSTENRGERMLSKDIFSKSVEALGKLGELSEVAVRLGVYTRVRDNAIADFVKKNGRKPNGEEMDVIKTEAVVSARQIIDFAQGGSFTKNAELVMPYLNASFQGGESIYPVHLQ